MKRLWMALACALVLLPNAAAMIAPFEAWPLTNAPMFASDLKHSAIYKLRLRLVPADGSRKSMLRPEWLSLPSWHLDRLFLGSVWGAAHPATPIGRFQDDTREALSARADRFFDAVVEHVLVAHPDALEEMRAIEVEIERRTAPKAVHLVGRYDLRTRTFAHLWRQP